MKSLLTLMWVFFSALTLGAQADLCAQIKNIVNMVTTDDKMLQGKKISEDEWGAVFECPVVLQGATSKKTFGYPEDGGTKYVEFYFAKEVLEVNSNKTYADLVKKFKTCFPDFYPLQNDEEGNYDEGIGTKFPINEYVNGYAFLMRIVQQDDNPAKNTGSVFLHIKRY